MWGFPADRSAGQIGGALVCGDGAVPSSAGTVVFLNANPDLQVVLDRVAAAGGKILMPKTAIEMDDAGYFAMIADTEGNTVGLQSQG
jgi:predicted enzyme related to lactoylglutathione lyase